MGGGTKRRRGEAKATKQPAGKKKAAVTRRQPKQPKKQPPKKATPKVQTQTPSNNAVLICLQRLKEIAGKPNRSVQLLQALIDSRCPMEAPATKASAAASGKKKSSSRSSSSTTASTTASSTSYCWDGYWLVMATSIMNRLIVSSLTTMDESTLIVLSAYCDCMSRILIPDNMDEASNSSDDEASHTNNQPNQAKLLEKASHSSAARPILARAIFTTTVASLRCVQSSHDESGLLVGQHSVRRRVICQRGIASIDRLVHLEESILSPMLFGSLWPEGENVPLLGGFDVVESIPSEEAFVVVLLGAETGEGINNESSTTAAKSAKRKHVASTTTTNKRAARSRSSKKAAPKQETDLEEDSHHHQYTAFWDALNTLLESGSNHNQNRLEGRVALKRWASLALVWSCNGQVVLLDTLHRLAVTQQQQKQNDDGTLPPYKYMSLMMSLATIVSEAGANCGARPPTGGIDAYLKSITGSSSTKKSKATRSDIRLPTVVAIQDLLNVHRQCLESVSSSIHPFVNDDAEDGGVAAGTQEAGDMDDGFLDTLINSQLTYVLKNVARAASTSVTGSSFGDQGKCTHLLLSLACAWAFPLLVVGEQNRDLPLDCSLMSLVINHLRHHLKLAGQQTDCFPIKGSSIVTDADTSPLFNKWLEKEYAMSSELPCSVADKEVVAWFAQDTVTVNGGNDALAIMMRGLIVDETTAASSKQELLVAILGDLIGKAYNRKFSSTITQTEDVVMSVAVGKAGKGRKRAAASSSGRRNKKRRKGEASPGNVTDGDDEVVSRRISAPRAEVAEECLHALTEILSCEHRSSLVGSFRPNVSVSRMVVLLSLGADLEKAVINHRRPSGDASESPDEGDSPVKPVSTEVRGFEFTPHEHSLWEAHVGMNEALGRGRRRFNTTLRTVFTDDDRTTIVNSLLSGCPVALPVLHQAFLIANMTQESTDGLIQHSAETAIAKECLKSLENLLKHPEAMKKTKQVTGYPPQTDHGIPLSVRDARVLVLAISRLPSRQQVEFLEELVKMIMLLLSPKPANAARRRTILSNPEASSLLARVVVLCVSLINVCTARDFRETLFSDLGRMVTSLRTITSGVSRHRCERYYMSMLSDWESMLLPPFQQSARGHSHLNEKTISDVKEVFELGFALGLESAPLDCCHLSYACWNAMGKMDVEHGIENRTSLDGPTLLPVAVDYPRRLLEIRNDVCILYELINSKSQRLSPTRLKIYLKTMLSRAENLIQAIVEEIDSGSPISIAVFPLMSALPVYVASCVSAFTLPGSDELTTAVLQGNEKENTMHQLPVESDGLQSDLESVESLAGELDENDALLRLRGCCDSFGAAPMHPDWLDVGCSLREGIRFSDAIDSAERAMRMLNKLTLKCMHQYDKHVKASIASLQEPPDNGSQGSRLFSNLLMLSSQKPKTQPCSDSESSDTSRIWVDDITAACGLAPEIARLVTVNFVEPERNVVQQSFCPNAAPRLTGHLQRRQKNIRNWMPSSSALRATGEWEILLAESLAVSFVNGADSLIGEERNDEEQSTNDPSQIDGSTMLQEAVKWRSIAFAAAAHLMPASALVRMGITGGGRTHHPLLEIKKFPHTEPLSFSEQVGSVGSVSSRTRSTVLESLVVAAKVSLHGDQKICQSSRAVASHLLIESVSFDDLRGFDSIRYCMDGIQEMIDLIDVAGHRDGLEKANSLVTERLLSVIQDYVRPSDCTDLGLPIRSPSGFQRVLTALVDGSSTVGTVVSDSSDVRAMMTRVKFPANQAAKTSHDDAFRGLVRLLCQDGLTSTNKSRDVIAFLISGLLKMERSRPDLPSPCLNSVVQVFNKLGRKSFETFVVRDFLTGSEVSRRPLIAEILAELVGVSSTNLDHVQLVFDQTLRSFDEWYLCNATTEWEPILDLLVLYSLRLQRLDDVGSTLSRKALVLKGEVDVKLLASFLGYLREVHSQLKRGHPTETSEPSKEDPGVHDTIPATKAPQSCSFVEKSGFHGQHWYNCYTCGLVWDKGCCTLCANVCHQGHDVSYSRYSSFFCDCGAECSSADEQNRTSCKCITPVTGEQVDQLYEDYFAFKGTDKTVRRTDRIEQGVAGLNQSRIGVRVASSTFPDLASTSLSKFLQQLEKMVWVNALFDVLQKQFEEWKSENHEESSLEATWHSFKAANGIPRIKVSQDVMRNNLINRKATPLVLEELQHPSLVPLRAVTGLQLRMPLDNSINSHLSLRLSRSDTGVRSVLTADSRGRLVIAESSSLLLVAAIPTVNFRHTSNSLNSFSTRDHLCILGRIETSFSVVGTSLCAANEQLIVVWGLLGAKVCKLSKSWNKATETIDLGLDLDHHDHEGDFIIKCEWIPGSRTHVAVGCSRFVHIFDVGKTLSGGRAHPVLGYNLGFEACLRDLSFAPLRATPGEQILGGRHSPVFAKLFLLLENGRLHTLDFKARQNGDLESVLDDALKSTTCHLPTAGIRPRVGSLVGNPGTTVRSMGEGSVLTFLSISRVLIYKCNTTCVLALLLGSNGEIEGSFELLPHIISPTLLGNSPDGYSIVGPFTHFVELGIVYHEENSYFRISCIGRSTRNKKAKLLCIDFNATETKIKELSWTATNHLEVGFGFEGLTAFSAPLVSSETTNPNCGERVFLCAATSSGSLLFFGEEKIDAVALDDKLSSSEPRSIILTDTSIRAQPPPRFPLTLYEKLKNVSDSPTLLFRGSEADSNPDDLRSSLSRDTSSSLVCPRGKACTISISLSNHAKQTKTPTGGSNLVIAALRVLVGSTSNCVPTRLYVHGRSIDLTPNMKKWYSIPLTKEEIVMTIRCGVVAFTVESSMFAATNNAVVDSLEVFACERKSIDHWLPKSFCSIPPRQLTSEAPMSVDRHISGDLGTTLVQTTTALAFLSDLSTDKKKIRDSRRGFLQELIQQKKCRQAGVTLLESLSPDSRSSRSFCDESILFGCSAMMRQSKEQLSLPHDTTTADTAAQWKGLRVVMIDCLRTCSEIARERPMSYLQSMESLLEKDATACSVASDASKFVLEGLLCSPGFETLLEGPFGMINLLLTEIAIKLNTDAPHGKQFAKVDRLRSFLESKNPTVVESCCRAIVTFCGNHNGKDPTPNLFSVLQNARLVAYQCDSCSLCPLKDVRYTLLDEDYDIDLCKECYEIGSAFAKKNKKAVYVHVNGKKIGGESKLTCAQIQQMESVSLLKMDVEQIDAQTDGSNDKNHQRSQDKTKRSNPTAPTGLQPYDYFIGHVFSFILDRLSSQLRSSATTADIGSLLGLLLHLVKFSTHEATKTERVRRFVKDLSAGLSFALGTPSPQGVSIVVVCLRAFRSLLRPDHMMDIFNVDTVTGQRQPNSKANTQSKVHVCQQHQIPAVKRKGASGAYKDRRFYLCGMERGQRCGYFAWADEEDRKQEHALMDTSICHIVQGYLWSPDFSGSFPLHIKLCAMLENELVAEKSEDIELSLSLASRSTRVSSSPAQGNNEETTRVQESKADYDDGVHCSRERLREISITNVEARLMATSNESNDHRVILLETMLDLLVLIADHKSEGISRWFSLLCELLVSTSQTTVVRALAKKVLKTLCQKDRARYKSVRDHFAFWFLLKRLYRLTSPVIEAALVVREKSRVCSPLWSKTDEKLSWASIGPGDLIGTEDLVDSTESTSFQIGKVLDVLWLVIRNRGANWRGFCGLLSFPHSQRTEDSESSEAEQYLAKAAPIVALLWIASSLNGQNQVKTTRLVSLALTNWNERKKSSRPEIESSSADEVDGTKTQEHQAYVFSDCNIPPEKILMDGKNMKPDHLVRFVQRLLHDGKSTDLRRAAYPIAVTLCGQLEPVDQAYVFELLMSGPLYTIGRKGKASVEFLNLLQLMITGVKSPLIEESADSIVDCYLDQVDAMKYGRANEEWFSIESSSGTKSWKRKFELAMCDFCSSSFHYGLKEPNKGSSQGNPLNQAVSQVSAARAPKASAGGSSSTQPRRHQEQVCPFARSRLEGMKQDSASNEFCSFFLLKHRFVLSDVHLTVNDPRGRYVKTVKIYILPRPEISIASLKSSKNRDLWQLCATIELSRGAGSASVALDRPMIAANLKVEYSEFYERPGGSLAPDGTLLVHCPRCSRVVTNAHGVCGNCGEVAFQCRKCRHINYDKLDAFLCVECGFCASGSFSFELSAAVATNAVAITDDLDYERGVRMLKHASFVHSELRDELKDKLSHLASRKKSSLDKQLEFDGRLRQELKRGLSGLPLEDDKSRESGQQFATRFEQSGSIVKFISRPDGRRVPTIASASSADRTRSLIRLARQIQTESAPTSERRSNDAVIRHLGRGLSLDSIDEEQDLLGLFGGGGALDSSESLSRVIANVQSRRREEPPSAQAQAVSATNRPSKTKASTKELVDECSKLYQHMREAEKERSELERRIMAWERLDSGALACSDVKKSSRRGPSFIPSHCSNCGSTVAIHLLNLWLRLFLSSPNQVDIPVDFLSALFEATPQTGKTLVECKRQVVREIAIKSSGGASLVLSELRKRLRATQDMASAEILGKILEDGPVFLRQDFEQLALETLGTYR